MNIPLESPETDLVVTSNRESVSIAVGEAATAFAPPRSPSARTLLLG